MVIDFTVPGNPQGKARHRMTKSGRTYTPDKTVAYESLVKLMYKEQAHGWAWGKGQQIGIKVVAYYGIPHSTARKYHGDMLHGKIRPTKKPDADNIAKIIADGLNGVAYYDDAQIVSLQVEKRYGDWPCVQVRVEDIENTATIE
jgi:Holliday junction resolvase RusA-like endonuclease